MNVLTSGLPSNNLLVVGWISAVNVLTFVLFAHDKRSAIRNDWRVPEAHLLGLAVLGGSPAALLARQMFRHKTRKQPFSAYLLMIVGLQIGALAGVALFGFDGLRRAIGLA